MTKIETTTARFRKSSVLSGIMVSLLIQNGTRPKADEIIAIPVVFPPPTKRPGGIKTYAMNRLRKVLLPIAHRIELRVRSAIEKTGLAANIFDVRNNVAAMKDEIADLRNQCHQILQLLQASSEAAVEPRKQPSVATLGDGLLGIASNHGYLVVHRSNPAVPHLINDVHARDAEIIAFISRLLGPGECLLSIGAGSGLPEMAAAAKVGKDGSVIVICTDEHSANAMRIGSSINRVTGIIDIQSEPAGVPQDAVEKSKLIAFGKKRSVAFNAETQAKLRTLKSKVRLAKIDMAGAELDALRTLRPLIESSRDLPIILALPPASNSADADFDLAATLREFDLVACVIDPSTAALREMRKNELHPSLRSVLLLRKSSPQLAQHSPRLRIS